MVVALVKCTLPTSSRSTVMIVSEATLTAYRYD